MLMSFTLETRLFLSSLVWNFEKRHKTTFHEGSSRSGLPFLPGVPVTRLRQKTRDVTCGGAPWQELTLRVEHLQVV
ncbi:hypothetical protein CYMTET_25852 [Cymbomonas tetramitiformis]|uniref:Uncharacterized protein n=1 Tax=Cymbomonas tetramitiformis TaxID=36881 RepID=A0AAE0FTK6_9CHLO|nr:hypothetical protein CYMTET_25852 [Cymbomonas tetramitiformis]